MNRKELARLTKAQLIDLILEQTRALDRDHEIRNKLRHMTERAEHHKKAAAHERRTSDGGQSGVRFSFARKAARREYEAAVKNGHAIKPGEFAAKFVEKVEADPSKYRLEKSPAKNTVIGWIKDAAPPELRTRGRPSKKK